MRPALVSSLLGFALITSACSGGGSGILEVTDSWAPTTPPGAPTAAVYLTIDNGTDSDDRLVSVSTDRCGTIELHSTEIDENRIMRMRLAQPESLTIPSGETLEMVPGGLHVMCIEPTSPFADGETLDLVVTLESAGDLDIATVVENR